MKYSLIASDLKAFQSIFKHIQDVLFSERGYKKNEEHHGSVGQRSKRPCHILPIFNVRVIISVKKTAFC